MALDELRRALARVLALLNGRKQDNDFDDELSSHLAMSEADLLAAGASPHEARRQARLRLGSPDAAREAHRDARGYPQLDSLLQDVRFAARTLRRDPLFATAAVLILAITIGANTAVYGVVRAILLEGLPFAQPDRLVWIANDIPGAPASLGLSVVTTRAEVWREWQRRTTSFAGIAAYDAFFAYGNQKLTGGGDPVRIAGVRVSRELFSLLGVSPQLGRTFTEAEMLVGGPRAVLLGDGLWRRRFAADPSIVGRAITLDEQPVTVVGVLPADFDFSSTFVPGTRVDVFTPLVFDEVREWGNTLAVIGRLKPAVAVTQAQQDLELANAGIKRDFPKLQGYGARAIALGEFLHGRLRRSLLLLWGAVGAVLLIACANLSNLLLTRSAGRRREFAVRVALGAGRARLLRQLLTESLLLCSVGAALGIGGAWFLLKAVRSADTLAIPLLRRASIDGTVLGFTVLVTVGTALLVGLLPGLRAAKSDVHESLKAGARGSSGKGERRLVSALVSTEIAIACTLLVVAGVLTRSLLNVLDVNLGFRPESAIAVKIDPTVGKVEEPSQRMAYFADAVRAAESVPGVVAAGVTDTLPLDRNRSWGVARKGVVGPKDEFHIALVSRFGPGVIRAMGMTLQAGRDITGDDRKDTQPVVVVNQALVRALFPGESALGRLLTVGGTDHLVVGVVADVRHGSLETAPEFEVYLPIAQRGHSTVDLVVRTSRPAGALVGDLRAALLRFDPTLPVDEIRPISFLVDRAISPRRFITRLLGAFAAVALVLAALGIYGVIAASVTVRTREIGIRMALGAAPAIVRRQMLGEAAVLAGLGVVAGIVGALAVSRIISSLAFGVSALDPMTFAAAPAALLLVALLAALIPALRAARTNPVSALRAE
jgi:predicted permease